MNNEKLNEMAETFTDKFSKLVFEIFDKDGIQYNDEMLTTLIEDVYKSTANEILSLPEVKAAFEALKSCEVNGSGFTNMRVKQALADLKKAGLV